MRTDKYRFEYGSVYEYDENKNAYIFVGKLNGETKDEFIADYETRELTEYN